MTKEQYELLVKQNLLARQRAAAMGQVVSSGGIDFGTGQKVPAFKFGPIELGDATDYAKLGDDVLLDTAAINRSLIKAGEEEEKEKVKTANERYAELMAMTGIGDIKDITDAQIDYRIRTQDLDRQEADEAANRAIYQSQMQLASAMPYLNEAARVATERNLDASQRFLDFKESMPTAVQNRMLASSTAYAQNLQGVATAANAAANMVKQPRRFG